MTATIRSAAASSLRLLLLAGIMLGPVAALAIAKSDVIAMEKRGAGLVLFVSLQRQSMS
ncbi:hypothetical protein J5J10_11295 [Ciceribacter sp. L1K23]|uniref:hypothetical protein n=1 Tax=unclassified Ciceribacter TaxID=2628820 RepID=UPI001ABE09D3|nr:MULTISPECIES: hypothetical protein [unclassified Ciceribacter]MBO3759580.1 hypothetical protein [Ciceribacter sp. L1K22]MBR0556261.1 hypothetical protein [Ciceribacter sp. L1K23]